GCGIVADIRVDDHAEAPTELARVHDLATLVLGGPEDVQPLEGALYEEVAGHLRRLGYDGTEASLADWAGVENLENRLVPGGIDARVLAELRRR
ncbi:MAG TPA: putative peptidoglycan binding domain-containing protein, partial [Propionibacteriaceae bacterium]|nr:putative peptidoglycan binding domain-containing protein [Propionibacteriaceae bacterium]